jgi:hypothetical protein
LSVVVWPRVAGVYWCTGDFLFDGGETGDLNAEQPFNSSNGTAIQSKLHYDVKQPNWSRPYA